MRYKKHYFIVLVTSILIMYSFKSNTDDIFTKKYVTTIIQKVADWQLENPKWAKYEWQNAPLYNGIWATYKATNNIKYYNACLEMGKENHWKPGKRWYHADDIAIGQVYLDMYGESKNNTYIAHLKDSIDLMFSKQPGFKSKHFPKELSKGDLNFWWWCDALYMGPPTLIKLGLYTNNMDYLTLSDHLFKETYDKLWNKEEHLFARDARYVHTENNPNNLSELNGEKIFWSRGNGWVIGGLVTILNDLPKDWKTRPQYETLFVELADRLADIQPNDGLWRSSLLDTENYTQGESSGTSFILYGLAWGVNNGYLDKEKYTPIINKSWIALNQCINKKGRLGFAQPVGASPKRNFKKKDWEVYASGAFCLAASEMLKFIER